MNLNYSFKKLIYILLLCTFPSFIAGCETTPLRGGFTDQGDKVYLTDEAHLLHSIQEFAKNQDLESEDGKINFLLYRVRQSNLIFMRNESPFDGPKAAEFLRWKLNRPRWRPLVSTAEEFVIIVTKGSATSGEPYQAVLSNKNHHDLASILLNELNYLEKWLDDRSKPVEKPTVAANSVKTPSEPKTAEIPTTENNIPAPAEVPAESVTS